MHPVRITIKLFFANIIRSTYASLLPLLARVPVFRTFVKKISALFPSLVNLVSYSDSRVYKHLQPTRMNRQILIDVTHMSKTKLNTGIQRVVRCLVNQFSELAQQGVNVEEVVLTSRGGFWHYEYLHKNPADRKNIVVPKEADVFLGLDLNAQVIAAQKAGLFDDWKSRDVQVVFAIHDILPIEHPEWWPNDVSVNHEKWLRSVLASANTILSVSKATQQAVQNWCSKNNVSTEGLKFEWFHLGADFEAVTPSKGFPEGAEHICNQLKTNSTFLSVGTIEPRKGFEQCLDAFELLWQSGKPVNLVFVGKQGWMVDKIIRRFKSHPELNKRFFWLDGISDEYLNKVYTSSDCLIAASNGEGFGIPLIEAARHGLPIIARDIPIFKEVLADNATYFSGQSAEALANTVSEWLCQYHLNTHTQSAGVKWYTWKESALKIKTILGF